MERKYFKNNSNQKKGSKKDTNSQENRKDFFCVLCHLQFDKKIVFDIHQTIVHGKDSEINCVLNDDDALSKSPEKTSLISGEQNSVQCLTDGDSSTIENITYYCS